MGIIGRKNSTLRKTIVDETTLRSVGVAPLTATGTLASGETDFNIGELYRINSTPLAKVGDVEVYIAGLLQSRNSGNVASDHADADGDYQEIVSSGNYGTIIRFNSSTNADREVTVIGRSIYTERSDEANQQVIENINGKVSRLIPHVASLAGVEESEFSNSPTNVDLKAFGDRVINNSLATAQNVNYTPNTCLLYTSPSPRDRTRSRMPSSA